MTSRLTSDGSVKLDLKEWIRLIDGGLAVRVNAMVVCRPLFTGASGPPDNPACWIENVLENLVNNGY